MDVENPFEEEASHGDANGHNSAEEGHAHTEAGTNAVKGGH